MRCFVLGSGAYGTALAWVLAQKGISVDIWCRRAERAREIESRRHAHLPDVTLPEGIRPVIAGDPDADYELVISAVPTQYLRPVLEAERAWLSFGVPWASASKGLEIGTQKLPSEILAECGVIGEISVISGPSHAEEVARGVPTAVTLGTTSDRGEELQTLLSGDTFRVYLNRDLRGVEIGGALKNVTALAAGMASGRGFGDNTLAALITRGAVEMARLGVALGGERETFQGLSGIGDLIVTCFSKHSRNWRFGNRVGQGEHPRAILESTDHAVEGVHTVRAVVELSRELGVEMPIAEAVHRIVHEGEDVEQGVQRLLRRSLKAE